MNRWHGLGNLGSDPELRMTAGGTAVLKFSLATNERWKDQSGAKQERTEWHRIVMFGKRAEGLARHLAKGMMVAVEGKIQYGSYEKDGITRYTTDIVVDQLHFCGSSKGGKQASPSPYGGSYASDEPAPAKDFDDDDIPF